MSYYAVLSALEVGCIFGLVALGVYISFRALNFPDLTVDGSFTIGAALVATLIVAGVNAWAATLGAVAAGMACGLVTALLNRRFGMLHLLAGILTTIGLFSINLRIMGQPNIPLLGQETVLTPFENLGLTATESHVIFSAVLVVMAAVALTAFLNSEYGLALRATGANPRMAQANGTNVDRNVYVGLALSNGLAALAGAVFAQSAGFADVGIGTGVVLFGLAAVILGEVFIRKHGILITLLACVAGSIIYRIAVGLALNAQMLGLRSSDLRLVTAVLVAAAFIFSSRRSASRLQPLWRRAGLFRRKAPAHDRN